MYFFCVLSSTTALIGMGGGLSCQSEDGAYVEPQCPTGGEGHTGGGAHLGDRNWHTETTSYVSVGLFNLYLSMTITSSGVFLGFFIGMIVMGVIWVGVERRKKKKLKRKEDQEREKGKATALEQSLQKVLISGTGSHSTTWPAFKHPQQATAPPETQPQQNHHLVPVAWGQ